MNPIMIPDLKATIEALPDGESVDLSKETTTASAARQAVQRIYRAEEELYGVDHIAEKGRLFKVSEVAYPGGTRVTRVK
jgi:hypothetical protein